MKEVLKKIAIAGTGSLFLAGMAFAAPTIGNDTTGRDSNNKVDWFGKHTVTVKTDNNATIHNGVMVDQNTGLNIANNNGNNEDNSDPSISTGDASATVSVTNRANDSTVDVSMPASSDADVMNSNTGRDSDNTVKFDEENSVSVVTNNNATVCNQVNVMQNTGKNRANDNDGSVSITTGSASADVTLSNTLNMSDVTVR